MAQVPYNPVPNALEPAGRPEPEGPRVDTPPAAFGVNIGQAVTQGGQQVGQVGNELFARALEIQGLNNENKARETSITATQEMAQRFEQFDALEGQARHDALPGVLKDLNDIRVKYRSGLNPMAARMYDQDAANLQNSFTRYAALRAGQGLKDAAVKNAQAGVDLATRPLIDPFSEDEFQSRMGDIRKALAPMMQPNVGGWSQQQYDAAVLKQTTIQRTIQIGMQVIQNPTKAFETYDAAVKNKEISGPEAEQLLKQLQARNKEVNGNDLARTIYKAGGSLEDMEAKAEELSPQYAHGDTTFSKSVIQDLRGLDLIENQAIQQQKRTDEQVILDAIHKTNPPSERVLLQDPDVLAAYNRAQAHGAFKTGLQTLIQANLNDRNNQQNTENWQALRGMYLRDRAGFLDATVNIHSIQMDKDQRADILNLRKQAISNPIADPRVGQALRDLKQTHYEEMRTLGVLHEPPKDADESIVRNYDLFLASVESGLDEYARAHNGQKPTGNEFETFAKHLLATHQMPGMFGVYGGPFGYDRGSWLQNIPKDTIEKARQSMSDEATSMGMPIEFSEREVYREILRQQWANFFKGSSGAGSTTAQSK